MNVWQFSWLVSAVFVQSLAVLLFSVASRQWVRSGLRALPFFLLIFAVPAEYAVSVVQVYLMFEAVAVMFEVLPDIFTEMFVVR